MKKLLVCGERSFVANGLLTLFDKSGIAYDCFSRGDEVKKGNTTTGDVLNMSTNSGLENYDTVLNFIFLKEKSVEENITYIKELLAFCKKKNIKHLIQISSISVYPNNAAWIDETSVIETDIRLKSGYAAVKVAVDKYIVDNPVEGLTVSFVRPGYVYATGCEVSKSGIIKSLTFINLLFGDKKTTLPLINRSILHKALVKIIQSDKKEKVYHLFDNNTETGTKYKFAQNQWGGRIVTIPRFPIWHLATFMHKIGVLKPQHYSKICGLYRTTIYTSKATENVLNLQLGKRKFCVIGAGAYGSYICSVLSEKFPHETIYLYDVGDVKLKDEQEIGYLSHVKANYTGLQKGRFFGLGGASVKWGGQLFTFSDNDFKNAKGYLKDIVAVNKKWSKTVFSRFRLRNEAGEPTISIDLFIKTGIWLGYFNRNLYRFLGIANKNQIHVLTNRRVVKLNSDINGSIKDIEYILQGVRHKASYDSYFLATGAFESARLLLNSKLTKSESVPFSDHLSQRVFKIKSGTKLSNEVDLAFKIEGTSLITKRLIGEIEGVSFFCHPIYNADFPFFQNLKKLLFGRKISFGLIGNIVRDIPSCLQFAWCMFVEKTMYVYNNEYYLQIDIENPVDSGKIELYDKRDKFVEKGLEIDFSIDSKTEELFAKSKKMIQDYLDSNKVTYEVVNEKTNMEKYEDTYHPFGIYSDFESLDDFYNQFNNLLVVNTGILPRAGGINSTCAVFPIIEEYIERM